MDKKIISLRLSEEDIKKLQRIAEKEGVKRSFIVKKAIKHFIEDYRKRPLDPGEISHKVSELEKRFGSLLTRVNILTTQVDKVIERLNRVERKI